MKRKEFYKNIIMKKFLSLILIISSLILHSSVFFACKNNVEDRVYSTVAHDEDIAYITLYTFDGKSESKWGLMNLGHAFIGIENISDEIISIYGYDINPNKSITLGTWSIWKHWGVWFNVESNYIRLHDKYNGRISITTGISLEDIDSLNEYVSERDKWSFLNNCSNFALNLWNTIAEDSEYIYKPVIYTPSYLTEQIKIFKNHQYNKKIETTEVIGFFDDDKFIEYTMEG